MKKIMLVGGGTGGHILPLYNLAQALIEQKAEVHLVVNDAVLDKKIVHKTFIPNLCHPEELRDEGPPSRSKFNVHYFKAYKLHYHLAFSNLINWFKILGTFWTARKLIKTVQPDALFFKGGFVGFPILIAAKFLTGYQGKIYLHESDISSGALTKLFGKWADRTFSNFGDKPMPLFYWPQAKISTPACHPEQSEGSKSKLPVILIFGGSQGAQFINDLIMDNVEKLCETYRVVLVTGSGKNKKYEGKNKNLEIHEFMDQEKLIEQIFCSSLVVARAGASMFQVLAAQKPLIAIPLPTAARNHQLHNAQYFAEKGLCYLLEQNKDTNKKLLPLIEDAINDPKLKSTLNQNQPVQAAKQIAADIQA